MCFYIAYYFNIALNIIHIFINRADAENVSLPRVQLPHHEGITTTDATTQKESHEGDAAASILMAYNDLIRRRQL